MKNDNVILKKAPKDKYVPEDFYSTTNMPTEILLNGKWIFVQNQRMDALIKVTKGQAFATKLRDIRKGDLVVCGTKNIRVNSPKLEVDNETDKDISFEFMANSVSSERRNELLIQNLAKELVFNNKKLTVVSGPVVVHTGADKYFSKLIESGYIKALLGGNAVAVHDIEKSYFGTSLGVSAETGNPVPMGYKNHMSAINRINKFGSIKDAVEAQDLKSGIMYQCVKNKVPFVLAGSLRDDGPLPDTYNNMLEAQDKYSEILKDADIVLILGTMLHGIASANMMSSETMMICVDISPSTVTKLNDRGSSQNIGIVTDVGLFLKLLYFEIKELEKK